LQDFCSSATLPRMPDAHHKAHVGRRLRAAIDASDLTQAEVARVLATTPSKLGNWLRGDNYPSAWFVTQFCERYGVTTDWIYRGVVSGMDAGLADRLRNSERASQREVAE
jgi:transcriptional regulator with XRE-family HTH domain